MKKITLISIMLIGFLTAFATAQMMGHAGHEVDRNLIFPHLALGEGYSMTIILMNPGQSDQLSGTLYFFKQDGTPLSVEYQGNTVSSIDVTLESKQINYIDIYPVKDTLEVGWALFELNDNDNSNSMMDMDQNSHGPHDHIFGTIIYSYTNNEDLETKVGVMGSRYEMGMFMGISIPVLSSENTSTGVAIVNTSSNTISITLKLLDTSGIEVSEKTIELTGGTQMALFIKSLFSELDLTNFRGSMEIRTEQDGMVTTALLQSGNVLTSIPVVHIPDSMYDDDHSGMGSGSGSGGGMM